MSDDWRLGVYIVLISEYRENNVSVDLKRSAAFTVSMLAVAYFICHLYYLTIMLVWTWTGLKLVEFGKIMRTINYPKSLPTPKPVWDGMDYSL